MTDNHKHRKNDAQLADKLEKAVMARRGVGRTD